MQTKILEEILAGLPSLNKKWKLFLQNLRTRKHLHFHQQKQLICRKWFRSLKRWKRKRMQMKQNPSLLFCPNQPQQLTEKYPRSPSTHSRRTEAWFTSVTFPVGSTKTRWVSSLGSLVLYVTNIRLGRYKGTGRSCGYACVEFKYKEVATVSHNNFQNH